MAEEDGSVDPPPMVPHSITSKQRKRRMTIEADFPWKKSYTPRNVHDLQGADHLIASELPEGFPEELAFRALAAYALLRTLSRELRLSPFTPNVFLRALNLPYPSRLIGQVHVALLRTLLPTLGYTYRPRGMAFFKKRKIDGLRWQLRGGDNLTYLDTYSWPLFYDDFVHLTADTLYERMNDFTSHIDFRSQALQVGGEDFVQSDPEEEDDEQEGEQAASAKITRGRGYGLPTKKGRGRATSLLQKRTPRVASSSPSIKPAPFQPRAKKRKVEEELDESESDASFNSDETESEDEDFNMPRKSRKKAPVGRRALPRKRAQTVPFKPDAPNTYSGLPQKGQPTHGQIVNAQAMHSHMMPGMPVPRAGLPMMHNRVVPGRFAMPRAAPFVPRAMAAPNMAHGMQHAMYDPMSATSMAQPQTPSALPMAQQSVPATQQCTNLSINNSPAAPLSSMEPIGGSSNIAQNPPPSQPPATNVGAQPSTLNSPNAKLPLAQSNATASSQNSGPSQFPPVQTTPTLATHNPAAAQSLALQPSAPRATQTSESLMVPTTQIIATSAATSDQTIETPTPQNSSLSPVAKSQPSSPSEATQPRNSKDTIMQSDPLLKPTQALPLTEPKSTNFQPVAKTNTKSSVAPAPTALPVPNVRPTIQKTAVSQNSHIQSAEPSNLPVQPASSSHTGSSFKSQPSASQTGQKRPRDDVMASSATAQGPSMMQSHPDVAAQRAAQMMARQHFALMQRAGIPQMGAMPRPGMMSMPRPGLPSMGNFPRPGMAPNGPRFMSAPGRHMMPTAAMGMQLPRPGISRPGVRQMPRPGVPSTYAQMPARLRTKAPPISKMKLGKAKARGLPVADDIADAIELFFSGKTAPPQASQTGVNSDTMNSNSENNQAVSDCRLDASENVEMEDVSSSAMPKPEGLWEEEDDSWPQFKPIEQMRDGVPYHRLSVEMKIQMLEFLVDELLTVDYIAAEFSRRQAITSCYPEPFGVLPTKDQLDALENADECGVCGLEGDLLCCDGCPSSYHKRCIGMDQRTQLPEGVWLCPECQIKDSALFGSLKGDRKAQVDWFTVKELKELCCPPIETQPPFQPINDQNAALSALLLNSSPAFIGQMANLGMAPQLEALARNGFGQIESSNQVGLIQSSKTVSPVEHHESIMVVHGFVFKKSTSRLDQTVFDNRNRVRVLKYESESHRAFTPREVFSFLKLADSELVSHWPLTQIPLSPVKMWGVPSPHSRSQSIGTYFITDKAFDPSKYQSVYRLAPLPKALKAGAGARDRNLVTADYDSQCYHADSRLLSSHISADTSSDRSLSRALRLGTNLFYPYKMLSGYLEKLESNLNRAGLLSEFWGLRNTKTFRQDTWTRNVQRCRSIPRLAKLLVKLVDATHPLAFHEDWFQALNARGGRSSAREEPTVDEKRMYVTLPDDWTPTLEKKKRKWEQCPDSGVLTLLSEDGKSVSDFIDGAKLKDKFIGRKRKKVQPQLKIVRETDDHKGIEFAGKSSIIQVCLPGEAGETADISVDTKTDRHKPESLLAATVHPGAHRSNVTADAVSASSVHLPFASSVANDSAADLSKRAGSVQQQTQSTLSSAAQQPINSKPVVSEPIESTYESAAEIALKGSTPKKAAMDDNASTEETIASRSRRSRRQGGHDKGGDLLNGLPGVGTESSMKYARSKKIKDAQSMLAYPSEKQINWPVCGRYFFDPMGYIAASEMKRIGRNAGNVAAPHVSYIKTQEVGQGAVCHVWRKRCLDCVSFEALILQIRTLSSFLEDSIISTCETAARRYGSSKAVLQKGIACSQRDMSNGEFQYFVFHQGRHRGCWLPGNKIDTSLYVIEREKRAEKLRLEWGRKALVRRQRLEQEQAQKAALLAAQRAEQEAEAKRKAAIQAAVSARAREAERQAAQEAARVREATLLAAAMKKREEVAAATLLARNAAGLRAPTGSQMQQQQYQPGPMHMGMVQGHPQSSPLPLPSRRETNGSAHRPSQRKREIQQYQSNLEGTLKQHELQTCKLLMQCLSSGLNAIPEQAMFEVRAKHLAQLRDANTKIGRLAGPNLKDEKLKVLMSDSEQIARTTFREKLASIKQRSAAKRSSSRAPDNLQSQHPTAYQQRSQDFNQMQHVQQTSVRQSPHQQMAYPHSALGDQSNNVRSRPSSASQNIGSQLTSLNGAQLYAQNQTSSYSPQLVYQQLGQQTAAMPQQTNLMQQQSNYGGQLLSPAAQQLQSLYGLQGQQQQQLQQQGHIQHGSLFQQQAMQLPATQQGSFQQHQQIHQPRSQQQRPQQEDGMPFDFEPRPLEEMSHLQRNQGQNHQLPNQQAQYHPNQQMPNYQQNQQMPNYQQNQQQNHQPNNHRQWM